MKAEIKERWCTYLETHADKQCEGALAKGDTNCVMGVLCEIAVEDGILIRVFDEYTLPGNGMSYVASPPDKILKWSGLESVNPDIQILREEEEEDDESDWDGVAPMIEQNDEYERTFAEFADAIREQF